MATRIIVKHFHRRFEGVKEEVMTFFKGATKILISDMRYSVHGDGHVSVLF
jgi:hypothetical protein